MMTRRWSVWSSDRGLPLAYRSILLKIMDTNVTSRESKITVSHTGVSKSSNGGPQIAMNGGIGGFAQSVKTSVLGFLTPSKEKTLPVVVESPESEFEKSNSTGERVVASSPASETFMSAREFFAKADLRDRLTSDYFSGTDTPSKLRESTRRLSLHKPHNSYIAYSSDEELDEWQQQPKSDYTYSESLTYRKRVTPDRKIGSPNMSRRGLKSGNQSYNKSADFSTHSMSLDSDSSHLSLRTRNVLRQMDALSDTSDEEVQEEVTHPRQLRSSRSRSIDMAKVNGSLITRTVTSSYTTTRTLHRGLDTESDVDDGTESTVPLRATPLTARSGTPLSRAGTPIHRPHSKSTLLRDASKGGYTLAKGAIAEDLEEEERPENVLSVWTKKTWQSLTRVTTIIVTSVFMMAATAVAGATANKVCDLSTSEKSSKYSFLSTMNTSRRKIMTVLTEYFESTRNYLRKNPVLLWIPLFLLFLLLAIVAYWWLLQSRAKTGDASDPTKTDGPFFLNLILTSASDLAFWMFSGISHGFAFVHKSVVDISSWLASAWYTSLSSLWGLIMGMFSLLGSAVQICLSYILHFLYVILEYIQYLTLAVLSFFSSFVSFVSGLFMSIIGTSPTSEDLNSLNEESLSWNIHSLASSFSPMAWMSNTYVSLTEVVETSGNWLWTGWLWLVLSVSEVLTIATSFILWLLSSLCSLVWYLASGLWTLLIYTIIGTIGFITSTAATVSSLAVETSSTAISNVKGLVLPFFQSSHTTSKEFLNAGISLQSSADTTDVKDMHFKGASVAEVVSKVINSEELKVLIASVASGSSNKEHLTVEDVSNIVKSVMESELGKIRKEATELRNEIHIQSNSSQNTSTLVLSLKQQHEHLLQQLDLLGAGLAKIEGSSEVDHEQLEAHQQKYSEQLFNLRENIEHLSGQLKELQNDHTTLATEVKSCCKNAGITLADVEKHITMLLGDILGLPESSTIHATGKTSGGPVLWSARDMGAWLKSYFVAKDELETRLNGLMTTLQAKTISGEEKEAAVVATQAAVAQTTQLVMETVLEKLRSEIQKQHADFLEISKQQVAEQVEVAAIVLEQKVSEQLEIQLHTSKQQLHDIVNAAVKQVVPVFIASAVSEAVATAVPDYVAAAVPEAVAKAVTGAVSMTMEGAVDTAVDKAVDTVVTDAVAHAIPDAVEVAISDAIADAVPKAVETALPKVVSEALVIAVNDAVKKTVSAEIQDFVAVAAQEAVASVLPSAVSTAVNETVSIAVAEAVAEVEASKAGDQHSKMKETGEGLELLAGVSSTSTSSGDASLFATVNLSKNNNGSTYSSVSTGMPFITGLNESAVIQIVKDALMKYDADKTGMVDHALESAGGNIISTRCTESYQVHQAEVMILGFPVYRYSTNNPRTIIQPDRMPGQCWAFKGSQGYIVIQLAGLVKPTAFSLEHIPKSLSPTGEIDSAPREFEVWGLLSENDEGIQLGSYEYSQNGEPLQSFIVEKEIDEYFPIVELKINSNHGNMHYTCLYRFRVHGVRHL
ncbi:uncharacterized protein [Cherax quadricarinatus]|uniref:uncharacterized protein isoform X5 n=1 Tax=Cherax quadricarinatus TaxID=27406 RepID=UPI00387E9468